MPSLSGAEGDGRAQPAALGVVPDGRRSRPLGTSRTELAPQVRGHVRRARRYRHRTCLRRRTSVRRLARCGLTVVTGSGGVVVRLVDGTAYFDGVFHCASVWACPVCSAKIRAERAGDVRRALGEALSRGWGVLFMTHTASHHRGDALGELRRGQEAAWKGLRQSRTWRRFREVTGARLICAREVTWGAANGWHPHRHSAIVTNAPLGPSDVEGWGRDLAAEWAHQCARFGLIADLSHGTDLVAAHAPEDLAGYLLKVEDPDLASELLRGDLKGGGAGRYTPELLLRAAVDDGAEWAWALWAEYEQATFGWRMLTWSHGLRRDLLGDDDDPTDEELVQREVGGELVAELEPATWRAVTALSLECEVLEAAEDGVLPFWLARRFGMTGWSVGGSRSP